MKNKLINLRWRILQYLFWHNTHKPIGNFIKKNYYKQLHNTGK